MDRRRHETTTGEGVMKLKFINEVVDMKEVKSSMFTMIGWSNGTLYLIWKSEKKGTTYEGVTEEQYKEGLNWASLGVWYNTKIKGNFKGVEFVPELMVEGTPCEPNKDKS
jgi:hypothetical protein